MYLLLNENNLCNYYDLDKNPGIKAKGKFKSSRFAYLDDEGVLKKLAHFIDATHVNITFSLPQMHCASCVFLLENLHKISPGIVRSQVHFQKKEVFISYDPQMITLRKVVELLAFIGYEPYISLDDMKEGTVKKFDRKQIFALGVAGFCFSNIMMLSFPQYFSGGIIDEAGLKETFIWIIFGLSLPVLFYAASGIFESAYKGLRQKNLNVDIPIALAIVITFARSYYEIISGTGSGYLDSGSGIIFFMLIGRWFQHKSYDALSFDRDYLSYFPLGVTILKNEKEEMIPVTKLRVNDRIVIRHDEMIPADANIIHGEALIDYSFVTGENNPVPKQKGEILFAGGKQKSGRLILEVCKEPSQSYITQLWNKETFSEKKKFDSFIHPWSKYFTIVLLSIALISSVYWYFADTARIIPVVSSILIVACPCSLLLTTTFTFGNMLRIFGRNKLYLKNAIVIETMSAANTIVFDKTGTITNARESVIHYTGECLTDPERKMISSLSAQSSHVLSRQLVKYLSSGDHIAIENFKEYNGKGISGMAGSLSIALGSHAFFEDKKQERSAASRVYARVGDQVKGFFEIRNAYRDHFALLVESLKGSGYELHLLSGDNDAERKTLEQYFEPENICFNADPADKLSYIKNLQAQGKKVMMVGDGLNDAGALLQSDVGIAVNDHTSAFTPACDAIIDGAAVTRLADFIAFARSGQFIITISFMVSILYNIVGISFAVQGLLSPIIAAILMPASSITIISLSTIMAGMIARKKSF